jgi:hypothetical protein
MTKLICRSKINLKSLATVSADLPVATVLASGEELPCKLHYLASDR